MKRLPWGIEFAISRGIEAARNHGKDAPSPYHDKHHLFPFWWTAVVTKTDCRDLSEKRIQARVLEQCKYRYGA